MVADDAEADRRGDRDHPAPVGLRNYRRVERDLIDGWTHAAYHLGGLTFERYLSYSRVRRYEIHDRLSRIIEKVNRPPSKD